MLDSIRFVQGAVSKKDYLPVLRHFSISGRRIKSYNGVLCLSAPIDLPIEASPKAEPFAKAITACEGEIALTVTPTGRIGIRSGKFRAYVDCAEEAFPEIELPPERVPLGDAKLGDTIARVVPFMSDDASRAWSLGVLLSGNVVIATNNVIAAEAWLGAPHPFPRDIAIPKEAVNEMMRIGEEPIAYGLSPHGLTLHYQGDRWLNTRLLSTEWPNVRGLIADVHAQVEAKPIAETLRDALLTILPFVGEDRRIFYGGNMLSTSLSEDDGSSFDIGAVEGQGIFNVLMLRKVLDNATHVELGNIAGPRCPFRGDGMRGVLMAYR